MNHSPLKTTENHKPYGRDLYIYIQTVKSKKSRKTYRYVVIEEYKGNGERVPILRLPAEKAIEKLLWCGGWDLNPRTI